MQDRRIQKSKDAIEKAFIDLMASKGFNQITIQDITDSANVGRRTFYHHYEDKYDLLFKMINSHISELRDICHAPENYNDEQPDLLWFAYFEEHYDFFSTMLSNQGAFTFRELLLTFVIEELQDYVDFSDGINKNINREIYMKFFGSAIVGVIEDYFRKQEPNTSKLLSEQVMILLNRNI